MSSETSKAYPFSEFEPRWQAVWESERTFRAPNPGDAGFDPTRPKYYVLDMFPYPSGDGLHVGHPEGYTATDIIGRYKRMRGFNVLHPMGWDAFGLPAEQYAIKTGQHPRVTTERNIANFSAQMQAARLRLRLGARSEHHRSRLLQVDAMDLPPDLQLVVQSGDRAGRADLDLPRAGSGQRAPRLRGRGAGELVPGTRHGAGQRGSHRRQERGRRVSGRAPADAAMDAADHGIRRAPDR